MKKINETQPTPPRSLELVELQQVTGGYAIDYYSAFNTNQYTSSTPYTSQPPSYPSYNYVNLATYAQA